MNFRQFFLKRHIAAVVVTALFAAAIVSGCCGLFFVKAEASLYSTADGSGDFARSQLSEEVQNIYDQLYEGIAAGKQEFELTASDSELIKPAIRAILADHPEFFWIDGNASITGYQFLKSWTIDLNFTIPEEEIGELSLEIENCVAEYLESLPEDAGDYTKARTAYEYIIRNTDYDLNSAQNQSIVSVFLNHSSVCAGYARAFQYLMHRAGVWCAYIEGTVNKNGSEEGHAWNLVCLNGVYTFVDPSWGDPTYAEDSSDASRLDIIYDYLSLTSEEMNREGHIASEEYALPLCTDTTYDYYRLNDMFYDTCDADRISSAIWHAVDEAETSVYFKFADEESYDEARQMIFSGDDSREALINAPIQQRMQWDELESMRYFYNCSDALYIIKLYW